MRLINRLIRLCFVISCLRAVGSSQDGLNDSPSHHWNGQEEVSATAVDQPALDHVVDTLLEGPPGPDAPEDGPPDGWDVTPKEDLPESSDLTAGEAIENVEGEFGEDDLRADRVTAQAEQAPAEETPPLPVSPGDVSEEKAEELVAEPLPSVNSSARANDSSPSDEDIPSFNEWTLKVLANEEKSGSNGEPAQPPPPKNGKLRQKNYASPDCGAKVILANPEAEHTSAILVPSRDEYFLSPCSAKIWFVIELCEAIQAQRIEIANFELFSSSPQDFKVFISDRYPTRDWTLLGNFRAADERSIQSFSLDQKIFGKFIKVELVSHYGREHFCPVSLFHVFGNSEYEVLDSENIQEVHDSTEEDMLSDQSKAMDTPSIDGSIEGRDLFGSAKDAVINIVKRAAQVLGKGTPSDSVKVNSSRPSVEEDVKKDCHTAVQQANVTKAVNGSLSCEWDELNFLNSLPWLQPALFSQCELSEDSNFQSTELAFARAIWGPATVQALCHWVVPEAVPDHSEIEPTVVEPSESKPEEVPPFNESDIFQPDELDRFEQIFGFDVEPGQEEQPPEQKPIESNQLNSNVNLEPSKPVPLQQQQQQQQQKESVFVRLSNRIKVLERNMSLSGQYLEELSRRYKRQVDDMQKSLNRTLQTLNETLHRMTSQEVRYQTTLSTLQDDLDELRTSSEKLHQENLSLRTRMESHLFLMVLEVLVAGLVIVYMLRRMKQVLPSPPSGPQPTMEDGRVPALAGVTGHVPEASPLTLNVRNLADVKKQQASPTPSLAESSSSGCESAFSFANSTRGEASRDPSPVSENKLTHQRTGKKQKKKKNQTTSEVYRVNNARSQSTGPKIRLKSDNWEWHSRAKVLAAQFIKENYDANGALRCSF